MTVSISAIKAHLKRLDLCHDADPDWGVRVEAIDGDRVLLFNSTRSAQYRPARVLPFLVDREPGELVLQAPDSAAHRNIWDALEPFKIEQGLAAQAATPDREKPKVVEVRTARDDHGNQTRLEVLSDGSSWSCEAKAVTGWRPFGLLRKDGQFRLDADLEDEAQEGDGGLLIDGSVYTLSDVFNDFPELLSPVEIATTDDIYLFLCEPQTLRVAPHCLEQLQRFFANPTERIAELVWHQKRAGSMAVLIAWLERRRDGRIRLCRSNGFGENVTDPIAQGPDYWLAWAAEYATDINAEIEAGCHD